MADRMRERDDKRGKCETDRNDGNTRSFTIHTYKYLHTQTHKHTNTHKHTQTHTIK